ALGYRHPIDISPEKVALILSHAVYKEEHLLKDAVNRYIFTPEEVLAAAKPMSQKLAQLSPDERLRFLISRSHWSDIFTGPYGTSGVIFSTNEGLLNLAFDRIQEQVVGGDEGDPTKVVFREEPTELRGASPVIPDIAMALHLDGSTGKPFPRWLEVT